MKIDVIIPTYNRAESLKATLKSLLACEHVDGVSVGILVVDNNSKDGTRQMVHDLMIDHGELKYCFEPKQGRCHAINAGVFQSNADIVALTDDDCLIDREWIVRIAANFRNNTIDILTGKIIAQFDRPLPDWLDMKYKIFWGPLGHFDLGDQAIDNSHKNIFAGGANLIVKRSSFERFGFFAKQARGQDTALCHLWQKQGAKIVYDPEVIVYHQTQSLMLNKKYLRQWQFVSGKNSALIFKEDHESSKRRLAGVPLWIYKRLFSAVGRYLMGFFVSKNNFSKELWVWFQLGSICGIRGSHDYFEEQLNTPELVLK